MTQSATRIANVKWNISVPPDLMKLLAFTLRLKEVKRVLFLLWSKRRFPVTSCLRLQERLRKRCVHLGYPRMSSTRLLRMELPGLRTNRDESRS